MSSTFGPKYAATAASAAGGGTAWSNPSNATGVNDNVYATSVLSAGASTNNLQVTNYGFSVPTAAVIDGILVEADFFGTNNIVTQNIQMLKAGSAAGLGKSFPSILWPGGETYSSFGGNSDTWGTTWTPSDINNSGFGVELQAQNTAGGGTAEVDAVRITVYWHMPGLQTRHIYKVYNQGIFIGNLPNVTSDFEYSQDINTAGATLKVTCGVSADTSNQAANTLTDESGNTLLDESSNTLTDEGQTPVISPGNFTTGALIKNGNDVQVWEYSQWNPQGVLVFTGEIERWEASFGSSGSGAAMGTGGDQITLLIYSIGRDLSNYLVQGNPYSYTSDQGQPSQNATVTITADSGGGFVKYGQTFIPSVSNIDRVDVSLNGTATVTCDLYHVVGGTGFHIGSVTYNISVTAAAVFFTFPGSIATTPGDEYLFTFSVQPGQSIQLYYNTAGGYSSGGMFKDDSSIGGGFNPVAGADLQFATYYGNGSTLATYTSADPSTGILVPILQDYITRGGIVAFTTNSIDATGLSVTTNFQTNTIYEALQTLLNIAPNGFFAYVDVGTGILYFQQTNTVADLVLTKGRQLEQVTIIATIESIVNNSYFTGGIPGGGTHSMYVAAVNGASEFLYGPVLDRPSDSNVTDQATAYQIASAEVTAKGNEQYQTTVVVSAAQMDLASISLGMMIGFNGYGTFIDNLLAAVVRIDRTPAEATLTLGTLPRRLMPSIEQLVKSQIALQTVANPTSPAFVP